MTDLDAIHERRRNGWANAGDVITDFDALLAEVDRRHDYCAEAFAQGAAAERARIRAAVEGLDLATVMRETQYVQHDDAETDNSGDFDEWAIDIRAAVLAAVDWEAV